MAAPVPARELQVPKFLPHQVRPFRGKSKRKIIRAGRRGGKSRGSVRAVVIGHGPNDALKGAAQGAHILWMAKDYPQAVAIWDRQLVPRCANVPGVDLNEQKKLIRFQGGGSIMLRSFESVDNVRGFDFDGVVMDECAFAKNFLYAWESVISKTLIDRDGWAIFLSTPKIGSEFNIMCEEQIASQDGTRPDLAQKYEGWEQYSWRTRDNTGLPKAAVDAEYARYPAGSTDAAEELDAELITEHGSLFSKAQFERRYHGVDGRSVFIPELSQDRLPFRDVLLIVDLATSVKQTADNTVIKAAGITDVVHGSKRAVILDVETAKIEGPEQLTRIAAAINRWKPTRVLIESVAYQVTAVQHLRRQFPATQFEEVRPDKDKRTRAVPWSAALSRGEVWFPQSAAWLNGYVQEHIRFTGDGKLHDDQVDTGSMLAKHLETPAATMGTITGVNIW